jgi:hypothetical protein
LPQERRRSPRPDAACSSESLPGFRVAPSPGPAARGLRRHPRAQYAELVADQNAPACSTLKSSMSGQSRQPVSRSRADLLLRRLSCSGTAMVRVGTAGSTHRPATLAPRFRARSNRSGCRCLVGAREFAGLSESARTLKAGPDAEAWRAQSESSPVDQPSVDDSEGNLAARSVRHIRLALRRH